MKRNLKQWLGLAALWPALLCAQEGAGTATATRQTILFQNGDVLHGQLRSIDSKTGVIWQHPGANEAMTFLPSHIEEIQLDPRMKERPAQAHPCHVHLTNKDELKGGLVSVDQEKLVLETWYAGTVTIPRSSVRGIQPAAGAGGLVFEGPDGLEGWTMGKVSLQAGEGGKWKYRNGAFYAVEAASIARDVKLPDTSSIDFDIEWRGSLNLAIALYTDYLHPISLRDKESEPDFGGFYSLQINAHTANLLVVKKTEPLRSVGQAIIPTLHQKSRASLSIRTSKSKRSILLLVDGAPVQQWLDQPDFSGEGTGIRIVHQGQGALKLHNLRVSEWDGRLEEKPAAPANPDEDFALLLNQDRVSGRLQSIRDGKATFAMEGSSMKAIEIPLSRVARIDLAQRKTPPAPAARDACRLQFKNRGSLTLKLEHWDESGVKGISPILGRLVLEPSAFERIRFQPD